MCWLKDFQLSDMYVNHDSRRRPFLRGEQQIFQGGHPEAPQLDGQRIPGCESWCGWVWQKEMIV